MSKEKTYYWCYKVKLRIQSVSSTSLLFGLPHDILLLQVPAQLKEENKVNIWGLEHTLIVFLLYTYIVAEQTAAVFTYSKAILLSANHYLPPPALSFLG